MIQTSTTQSYDPYQISRLRILFIIAPFLTYARASLEIDEGTDPIFTTSPFNLHLW